MNDFDLVKQIIAGDETAFKCFFEVNRRIVINTCFKFVNFKEITEDITQEFFIEVYRSIKHFKGSSQLSTWIYCIAVTKSIDYLRARKSQKRFALFKNLITHDEEGSQVPDEKNLNPSRELERGDRLKIIKIRFPKTKESHLLLAMLKI